MSRRRALVVAVMVPVAIVAVLIGVRVFGSGDDNPTIESTDDHGTFDYEFVIDPGTAERIAAGEPIEIVPRQLDVTVGESIRIINNDSANHSVGLFYVPAGQTLTQTFRSPGILEGECTVHPSGQFTLVVSDT